VGLGLSVWLFVTFAVLAVLSFQQPVALAYLILKKSKCKK